MTCRGSPTAPKMVDAGKASAVEGVGTTVTDLDPIERLEAIIYNMEAIDDGHRFRLAYLHKYRDTQMHFSELLELYNKDRVYDANIASAAKITARKRFGGALWRNDRDRDGGGGSRENFKTTRPPLIRRAPPSDPAAAYGAFRRVRRTTKTTTYFIIADAAAKAPWSEIMRGSIETLHGTYGWGAKATYVCYPAWIAERCTIDAGSLLPFLSAMIAFLRHTGRDDAPDTRRPAISDMKRALQIRQLKTSEELRRAPLPCDVITNILDNLANLIPMTTHGNRTILREGAVVCSTFMFYSRGESIVSYRLRDMAVDPHSITLYVSREKGDIASVETGSSP
eukprot:jgi/Tetstr1/464596/TSEL_009352.t1